VTAAITGLGAITCLGATAPASWKALLAGQSGISALTDEWAAPLPVRIAGRVAGDADEPFAITAAREAWADAGLTEVDPERLAVCVGSALGGLEVAEVNSLRLRDGKRLSPYTIPAFMANSAAATVAIEFDAKAGCYCPTSACASGAEAIAQGLALIRAGLADVVIAGGAEAAITSFTIAGFAAAQALSRRNDAPQQASRPFDVRRDGFVLSEGAAIVILESTAHAAARGAQPYAHVAGAGVTSDAYHLTAPAPDGAQQLRAMRLALAEADLDAFALACVAAHASSTQTGDAVEAQAIAALLGKAATNCIVTATKSQTGHLLGAAGALQAVFAALTIRDRVIPATINLDEPDANLPIDVALKPIALPPGDAAVLANSFGFGGQNVSLVFIP
jgi:3-oxoacyl-[acyl-carrier-protein] synthase II